MKRKSSVQDSTRSEKQLARKRARNPVSEETREWARRVVEWNTKREKNQ